MSEEQPVPNLTPATNVREFFREVLTDAIHRQRIDVRGETELYLVNLLSEYLSAEQLFPRDENGNSGPEPLAFMLKKAVEAPRDQRARHLRRMGDTALYMSGFFSDSLERSLVDVDYYAAMGGRAYGALSDLSRGERTASVFSELAAKFMRIVDLFSEISERAAITTNSGILRLYERYVRTGSTRLRDLLQTRGVLAVPGSLVVQ
jgi:hypothetical protein